MTEIYQAIQAERKRQNEQWGGDKHDAYLGVGTWLAIITKHVGKLADIVVDWNVETKGNPKWEALRHRLIVIAALCVALLETMEIERN